MFVDCLNKARPFVMMHGRQLERSLFQHLFDGGSAESVHMALREYINPDGGYGKALEPDVRCSDSYPAAVDTAFEILELTGGMANSNIQMYMVHPACDFLETITTPEGGVPFSLPVVNTYPHAPWWECEENPPASLNPTAAIAGRLRWFGINHTWAEPAVAFCRKAIEGNESKQFHDLMPVITFLESLVCDSWADEQLARLAVRISRPGVVEMDPQASGYVKMPLDWAPFSQSFCRPLFDDAIISRHLAALAARQQADGGWLITWQALSSDAEMEWRGWVTIRALRTLRSYEWAGFVVT